MNNAERRNLARTVGAKILYGINWLLVKTAHGLIWLACRIRDLRNVVLGDIES